ncbi:hypothetical protein [Oceaniglobus ichthyenteri]|uniref:hypothetical protein n=1 Tax=Oceaniglobus ichthyenteri TaxID=2136177 RepID=UPI000F84BC1C|nr:hypothetical protein [Oceaniglobus ichthyenteri]
MSPKLFLAFAAIVSLPPMAQAQNLDPIKASRVSAQMYRIGADQGDALLIIAAAKLRKQVLVERIERVPERDGKAPTGTADPALTWEAMLQTAQDLSVDDPQLTGLIDDVRAETFKGVRTGRVESYTRIRPGGTDTYRPLEFSVGQYADVYVEGSGDADLNLYIRDAQGRLVCSDTDISAIAYCGWEPTRAQAYAVEVRNKGRVASAYKLMTN